MLTARAPVVSRIAAAKRLSRKGWAPLDVRAPMRVTTASNFESPEIDTEALKAKATEAFTSATTTIKTKWDETDDKPAVISIAIASMVTIVALNGIADAINKIPVISNLMELVGIVATSWFMYRYLVFGPDREELKTNIMDFFSKVTGKSV